MKEQKAGWYFGTPMYELLPSVYSLFFDVSKANSKKGGTDRVKVEKSLHSSLQNYYFTTLKYHHMVGFLAKHEITKR